MSRGGTRILKIISTNEERRKKCRSERQKYFNYWFKFDILEIIAYIKGLMFQLKHKRGQAKLF